MRVVVSAEAEALAVEHIGGTYEHLFNGIEIERFADAEPWPTDGRTIFFLGRHEPRKGLDVLLAALPMLPADVTVWIGSDGPDTERLRLRHAGDPRIQWLGRLTDEEKRRRGCRRPTCSARRRCAGSRSASCCSRRWRPARRSSPRT